MFFKSKKRKTSRPYILEHCSGRVACAHAQPVRVHDIDMSTILHV